MAPVDAVEEIKKYKELLDLEIITKEEFDAKVVRRNGAVETLKLYVKGLTAEEKEILLAGCLMNYYKIKNMQA